MFRNINSDGENSLFCLVEAVGTCMFLFQIGGLVWSEIFTHHVEEIVDRFFVYSLWRKTAFVEQRHNGFVLNGLLYGIDRFDDAAKSAGGVLVFLHQRRSRESNLAGVGQHPVHLDGQLFVLAAVRFVNQDEDVGIVERAFDFLDGRGKLVDNRGDDGIGVAFQQFH